MSAALDSEPPFWFWLLLGFCLARGALRVPVAESASVIHALPHPQESRLSHDARPPCARELRAIPGIGQQRALGIVRARWEAEREGLPFELEQVSGIGPAIAWQISAWTAREGLRCGEAARGGVP